MKNNFKFTRNRNQSTTILSKIKLPNMKSLAFLLLICTLWSCSTNDDDYLDKDDGTKINIYIVKEGQINHSETEIDLENLEVESTPWLNHSEILFYDWSSHMFYTDSEKNKSENSGKYFLVKSDNQPLFLGYFMSPVSSSISYFPSITAWNGFYSSNVVEIGGFGGFHRNTMDTNKKFKTALNNADILKEGIKVDVIEVMKKNSSTIRYTFNVKNVDSEAIYVLDPDKMGTKHFHYFTNGVFFSDGVKHFSAEFQSESPDNGIPKNWFKRLAAGDNMTRKVELSGFSEIPEGNVNCIFRFPGYLPKDTNWKTNNGRYWLGEFRTEKELAIR